MQERLVTVPGSGSSPAEPDAVLARLSVSARGDGPAEALTACGAVQDTVLAALRAAGATDVRVGGVSVGQEWDQARQRPGRTVGTSRVTVTVPDVATAGDAVASALAAGGSAVQLDSLAPVLLEGDSALTAARQAAYADARERAEQYAALSGDRLGPLVSLVEGAATEGGGARAVLFRAEASASYTVPEGDVDVAVQLVATWELVERPEPASGP